jgi:hypothetical protein
VPAVPPLRLTTPAAVRLTLVRTAVAEVSQAALLPLDLRALLGVDAHLPLGANFGSDRGLSTLFMRRSMLSSRAALLPALYLAASRLQRSSPPACVSW